MKDALGHGSDARGAPAAHQAGVQNIGRPYKVQQFNPTLVGQPWETINRIGGKSKTTIAEHVARYMRADNRNPALRASRVAGIKSVI